MNAEVLDLLDEILAIARDVKTDMSELKSQLDRMVANLGDGVTPAKAGVQGSRTEFRLALDSRFRGNDERV